MNSKLGIGQSIFLICLIYSLERASYYGARAVIVLHLTTQDFLSISRDDILSNITLIGAISGFLLIPAGLASDLLLGLKRSISFSAIILTIGYICLLIPNSYILIGAAGLIIIGSSILKVSLPVQLGDIFSRNDRRRDAAFFSSYFAINFGAFLGILCVGYLGDIYGITIGLSVAGIFTILIFILFQLFNNQLADPSGSNLEESILQPDSEQILDFSLTQASNAVKISDNKSNWVKPISLTILLATVFGIITYWNGVGFSDILESKSEWSIFGRSINPHLLDSTSTSVSTILMIPIFLYLYYQNKWTRKQLLPFVLAIFGFFTLSLYFIYFLTDTQTDTPLFLIGGFSNVSELLFFSILISFVTISSPPKFKATTIGIYFTGFALSGLLVQYFDKLPFYPNLLFLVGIITIILSGVIWYVSSKPFLQKKILS